MMTIPSHFFSVFFLIGVIVIGVYAWQQFNKPSFPNQAALPRTVEPLRYLFLRYAYSRARFTYVMVLLLFYCLLVWPGKQIVPFLGRIEGGEFFPAEGWALLVSLILVGFVPNSNWKWLTSIEEALRRSVHAWFLVPDGVVKTIAVLADTSYQPPRNLLEGVSNPSLVDKLRHDLKLPVTTLQYRWARTTMLMESLQQMGLGAPHPLTKAAFDPFQQDFEDIQATFAALALDIEKFESDPGQGGKENLIQAVEALLKRIYSYISWGIRYQAKAEGDVDRILMDLGFRIPPTGGQRLLDIALPAVLVIAAITIIFWTVFYAAKGMIFSQDQHAYEIVGPAITAGIAAAAMYGSAIFIALKQRRSQIDQGVWREGSPTCLVPIALRAGLAAWAVIGAITVVQLFPAAVTSLVALAEAAKSMAVGGATNISPNWNVVPYMLLSAAPWFLAGATVSVVLAQTVGRNVAGSSLADRKRDAVRLGLALGVAAAFAQLTQDSLMQFLLNQPLSLLLIVPIGVMGAACGAIIGFVVPSTCKASLMAPPDRIMAHALQELVSQTEKTLGTKESAEAWVFAARPELGGITPAEAIQFKSRATSTWRLLDNTAGAVVDEPQGSNGSRLVSFVIEGGRAGSHRTG